MHYNFQDYFINIREKFLALDESNYNKIGEDSDYLMSLLQKKITNPFSSKIGGVQNFNYLEEIKNQNIPLQGESEVEVLDGIANAFDGCFRWHSINVAYNVIPSPLLSTIATDVLINLYNPNAIMDEIGGKFILYEKIVIKLLCDLAGIDHSKSEGISTFGGAGTLLYPIKIGINKTNPNVINEGINKDNYIITGENNHYSITSLCNFLGIGRNKCIRINGKDEGIMDLNHFKITLESLFSTGKNVACIIASGGETINHGIDNIEKIKAIRDELCIKYNIGTPPHIHMDSVNGRIWLFYKNYNFEINPLQLDQKILKTAEKSYNLMRTIQYADSFSADFHKTGLCPYTGAFFITNSSSDLLNINNDTNVAFNIGNSFGDKKTFRNTIEHSKSCNGIANAYIAIKSLGYEGFQRYIAYLLNTGNYIKYLIETEYKNYFEVINLQSNWYVNVIVPKFFNNQPNYKDLTKNTIEIEKYNKKANSFYDFYSKVENGDFEKPYLGYIQNHWDHGEKTGIVAFKIYNMSVHMTKENCEKFMDNLKKTLLSFSSQKEINYKSGSLPHTLK